MPGPPPRLSVCLPLSLGVTNAAAVRWEEAGALLKSEAKPQKNTDVAESVWPVNEGEEDT